MPKEWTQESSAAMDNAAALAHQDLDKLNSTHVASIANWYHRWYMEAGHKRLGRILASIGKEIRQERSS